MNALFKETKDGCIVKVKNIHIQVQNVANVKRIVCFSSVKVSLDHQTGVIKQFKLQWNPVNATTVRL